ncbi:MAG: 30S ribosomal protein S7 [Thermoplasmata archaeon]|nr:30S ribosomal protein S7 [Thermoplasmata archaeon]
MNEEKQETPVPEEPKETQKEKPAQEPPKEDKAREPVEKKSPLADHGILLFGKYSWDNIVIKDMGMAKYINLDPVVVPHSEGKFSNAPFIKARMNVVERLINSLMKTGKIGKKTRQYNNYSGKKSKAYNVVKKSFDIIYQRTKTNPLQVLVDAIVNSAPREETTRLQYGGISVVKSVDSAPYRRVNIAIRNLALGAITATHKSTKSMEECLANEIILAAKGDMGSFAVAKKEDTERIALSGR